MKKLGLLFATFLLLSSQSLLFSDQIVTLSKKRKVRSYLLPRGSKLLLDGRKNLLWVKLGKNTVLQGIAFHKRQLVKFYDDNSIKSFLPRKNTDVRGLMALSDEFEDTTVEFHRNGKLKKITLAKKVKVQDIKFHKRDRLFFFADGTLQKAIVYTTTRVAKMKVKAGKKYHRNWLHFFPNGKVKSFNVYTFLRIQELPMDKNQKLLFHDNGKLYKFRIRKPYTYQGLSLDAKRDIFLQSSGELYWQEAEETKQEVIWEQKGELLQQKTNATEKSRKSTIYNTFAVLETGKRVEINLQRNRFGEEFSFVFLHDQEKWKFSQSNDLEDAKTKFNEVLQISPSHKMIYRFECVLLEDDGKLRFHAKLFDRRKK
ncbi:MAG: hypothetical protein AAF518_12395 [Spirochaetota bacterium]